MTKHKLVIAEKPSVAISIAKVIGAKTKKDGYYEGNGYKVSWCVGHLIQMANPEQYDEKYKKWKLEDLPILPQTYQYEVSKATKKQFQILKKLMNSKDIDCVVNACDAGREGEAIFRLVYMQADCKKRMERLWISSMEDSAIKEGFAKLKAGKDFDALFESAQARAIADWLVGMNISRLYSCVYQQPYSVGRVQTPTLAMIVEREEKINHFKKEKYFIVDVNLGEFHLSTARIDDRQVVEQLLNLLPKTLTIKDVEIKEKITKPNLPYDLTTLQRECNKIFGYSAKKTLDIAQSLYEKKLLTYPRTDSRNLTVDMVTSTVNGILGKYDFDTNRMKVVFDSSKVTDHHAIIPTISSVEKGVQGLSDEEQNVYDLVAAKLHASMGYPLVEQTTKVMAVLEDFEFTNSGKVIVEEGFTKYMKQYAKKKEEVILPKIEANESYEIQGREIKEKFTNPPKHYTEDTLLKAMELAGTEDLEKGIEVERKGIGTPATRAGILESLISKGFVERDKKNLLATHKGVALVTIVSEAFKSAKTTAEWETKLSKIAAGTLDKEVFLKEIEGGILEEISHYQK
ncbi:DNA topoisomerase 3 [Streptococcus anginosus]|uniref:DNA topoisomerase 3 n=1 Tax=Streptococcus anginosus TaxID=1328 RepID=UPI0022E0BC4A|nr:DNA topoisomerase 3 [Streptococcus anginosus]